MHWSIWCESMNCAVLCQALEALVDEEGEEEEDTPGIRATLVRPAGARLLYAFPASCLCITMHSFNSVIVCLCIAI